MTVGNSQITVSDNGITIKGKAISLDAQILSLLGSSSVNMANTARKKGDVKPGVNIDGTPVNINQTAGGVVNIK